LQQESWSNIAARAINLPMPEIGQAHFSMKPFIFEASTAVSATQEALYSFHENPKNISCIAPRSLVVLEVACNEKAEQGGIFQIHAKQFGLPIRWTGRWEKAECPALLVDTAISSPFAIWRHSHCFSPLPQGALLTDRVEYLLKGGLFGSMVSRFVMPLVFTGMFRARHAATRRFFSKINSTSRESSHSKAE
jgi:ligand-binding SRPBCC domain-containing protein